MVQSSLWARLCHVRQRSVFAFPSLLTMVLLLFVFIISSILLPAVPAHAQVPLWLPTPPGERWRIIQGYACGTHNGWDRYSLDLASVDGSTYGAPIRASADGTIWVWVPGSGTIILKHSDTFYTMYTHLQSAASITRGQFVPRGGLVGYAGDRGSPGIPHLHFTAFTGRGVSASNRQSVPLVFADGYNLPEIGGCNQYGGKILIANAEAEMAAPGIHFETYAQVDQWYSFDVPVKFSGLGLSRGHSVAWNEEPPDDKPMFLENTGQANLGDLGEGLHTLYVRGWGIDGQSTLATLGPIGVDVTPPSAPAPLPYGSLSTAVDKPAILSWKPSQDNASGVAGYRVYLGGDPLGTSDWFVEVPEVATAPLGPGTYILRVQPIDFAGNEGEWTTLGNVVVQ